ncbi:DNA-protecting protein DprA [Candidatus Azambacteria bacterium]|nr:DNA-protecting protein DprA [Candidatus Azambacteria bacterium]
MEGSVTIDKMGITEISIKSKKYPEGVRSVVKPPDILFVRGELLPEDKTAVAIVGSRKCTAYGKQVAYDLAFALAKAGVTVVSGMALGIDGEAHKGALDAGGRTIAVLGTGVDDASIYPRAHTALAKRILKQGALVSEFEPGAPAYPSNFPQRNRIIAGLALGTVVVEANKRSGSLITPGFALEQGKDVFAVPGPIYSGTSAGTHALIQQGAKLITCAEDILQELAIEPRVQKTASGGQSTAQEKMILDVIEKGPADTDAIIQQLDLPTQAVLTLLAVLELKQKVQHIGNNTYVVKK